MEDKKFEENNIYHKFKSLKDFSLDNFILLSRELNDKLKLDIDNIEKRCNIIYQCFKSSLKRDLSHSDLIKMAELIKQSSKSNGKIIKVEILKGKNLLR